MKTTILPGRQRLAALFVFQIAPLLTAVGCRFRAHRRPVVSSFAVLVALWLLAAPAHAQQHILVNDANSCAVVFAGDSWDDSARQCTVGVESGIPAGVIVTIAQGVTLRAEQWIRVHGTLINRGTVDIRWEVEVETGGRLENQGTINVLKDGWLDISGAGDTTPHLQNLAGASIVVHDQGNFQQQPGLFQPFNVSENFGAIEILPGGNFHLAGGTIRNFGQLVLRGEMSLASGWVHNGSQDMPTGYFLIAAGAQLNSWAIDLHADENIVNFGTFDNYGFVDSSIRGLLNDTAGGTIVNHGTFITRAGAALVAEGSYIFNYGDFDNFGAVDSTDEGAAQGHFVNRVGAEVYNDGVFFVEGGLQNAGTIFRGCHAFFGPPDSVNACNVTVVPPQQAVSAPRDQTVPLVARDFRGRSLSYTLLSWPATGTMSGNFQQIFGFGFFTSPTTWTPPSGFEGTVSATGFAYWHNTPGVQFTLTINVIAAAEGEVGGGQNAVPMVTAPADQSANEGTNVTFELGSFADPGADSPWTVSVTWGDGSPALIFERTTTGVIPAMSHIYADNGLHTVTVTVTDKRGASDVESFQVSVANIAPAASLANNGPVNEGSPVTVSFSSQSDPSSADSGAGFHYAYACDGGSLAGAAYASSGSGTTQACTFDDGPATHTVRARIIDKDGGFTEYTTSVQVNNVNPTAGLTNDGPVDEGGAATISFSGQSDPSSADTAAGFHYAYACDGGSLVGATYAGSGTSASQSCTFDDGPSDRMVRARIIDKDGGFGEYMTSVQVNNVNPTASLANGDPVDEGSAATISFSGQSDPSSADTAAGFRYAYSCDGGSLAGATYAGSGSAATQSCTFDDGPATHTVRARIIDKDGGFREYTTDVTVLNVTPAVVSLGANPLPVDEASPTLLSLTFTDPGSGETHTAVWTFGDGTSLTDAIEALRRDSRVQTTYGDNGIYRARVIVTDDDGGSASGEIDIEVLNVAPAFVMASRDQTVAERRMLTFEITGHDVASADVLTLTLAGLPPGAEYTGDAAAGDVRGVFTWTPACNQSGDYPLTFTLRDDDGGEVTTSMTITVNEACRGIVAVTNRNGSFDGVTFVDPQRNEAVVTVDVSHQPLAGLAFYDMSFDADLDTAKLYVNQQGSGSVNVLIEPAGASGDPAFAFVPTLEVPVGKKPAGVTITPDGAQVWTADWAGDSISILDRTIDAVVGTIPLRKAGFRPEGIAFGREGRYAYVPARNSNNVLVVDRFLAISSPENSIVGSIATGGQPIAALLDPTGGLLYVATADSVDVLNLASPASPALVARVAADSPGGLAMAAGKLYVTNTSRDTVTVFAASQAEPYLAAAATILVGRQPGAIAAAPADAMIWESRVFVANRLSDSLTVIDALTDTVIATVPVGKHPRAVAVGIVPSR